MKTRFLSALIFGGLIVGTAHARIDIPAKHWISNTNAQRCGWAALETLARRYGIESLYGVADKHNARSQPADLIEVLTANGVSYVLQYPGNFGTDILTNVDAGRGVLVGLRELVPGAGGHIVLVVDMNRETQMVSLIDSNFADGHERTLSWAQFITYWDGFALVPYPPAAE